MKKNYPKIHLPSCPRTNCNNKAIIDPILGVLPCQKCQDEDSKIRITKSPEFYSLSKHDRINKLRDKHIKDTIQPFESGKINKEFFKAYPEQVSKYNAKSELEKL